MITNEKLQSIIQWADTPADVKAILRNRLHHRILKIRKQLNESEDFRFEILHDKIKHESNDILSIIKLIKYLPAQVDVNYDYLVKYIRELYREDQNNC